MSQGRAAVSSLGSERNGDLGDGFRGLAWDVLPMPTAPLDASHLVGSLRVRRCKPVGEKEGKGKCVGMLPGARLQLLR